MSRFSVNLSQCQPASRCSDESIDRRQEEWGYDDEAAEEHGGGSGKGTQLTFSTFTSWRSAASFLQKLQFLVMIGASPPNPLKGNQLVISRTDAIRALTMKTKYDSRLNICLVKKPYSIDDLKSVERMVVFPGNK